MIDGVADHMGERIGKALDNGLVNLGAVANRDEFRKLASCLGGLAHDARHALEQRFYRLSADRHDAFLNVARQKPVILDMHGKIIVVSRGHVLQTLGDHRLVDDQFTNGVDQAIHAVQIDPQRGFGGLRVRAALTMVCLGLRGRNRKHSGRLHYDRRQFARLGKYEF
jgi:hypothetical protein